MRYGLLALSIAMLASGAVAAQSALSISASAGFASREMTPPHRSLPISIAHADPAELHLR